MNLGLVSHFFGIVDSPLVPMTSSWLALARRGGPLRGPGVWGGSKADALDLAGGVTM